VAEPAVQADDATETGLPVAGAQAPEILAAFMELELERENPDLGVDPAVSEPAERPKRVQPQPFDGPLEILAQDWGTALGLSFVETASGVEVAAVAGKNSGAIGQGTLLTHVDGTVAEDSWAYFDAVSAKCEAADGGRISLVLGAGAEVESFDALACLRRIQLSNGLVVEARQKRGKWRLSVAEIAVFGRSDLEIGDQILVDYGRNVKMTKPQELANSIEAARANGAAQIELGIVRRGAIENAVLDMAR